MAMSRRMMILVCLVALTVCSLLIGSTEAMDMSFSGSASFGKDNDDENDFSCSSKHPEQCVGPQKPSGGNGDQPETKLVDDNDDLDGEVENNYDDLHQDLIVMGH
ncbi:hypothetical protein HYC85_014460 [Camellia sinensis]|uniref:Phytosulfokine-beta n=1 Tax=Camellia sinensis TaxID=4442 RepID=A0A7J7H689_CAMSI|nr:hypothetical protein HYC85_014460 [Camellia sinensis]